MWTGSSAKKHGTAELCSILNGAIREDKPNVTIHAVVFADAINILLVEDRAPQPWLKKIFQKKFPCVIGFRVVILRLEVCVLPVACCVSTDFCVHCDVVGIP